jgi:hypothetical protein
MEMLVLLALLLDLVVAVAVLVDQVFQVVLVDQE